MALGTCTRCGARVVWDPEEIRKHHERCKQENAVTPDAKEEIR